ncbi:Zn-ribbon domain-containing OB-fold protein [Chloroflexota bacterium]
MECKLTFKGYNEALKLNKLLGLKCKKCGVVTAPPKMVCRKCASPDMEVIELAGKGRIQTFTTCNVAPEGREDELPYVISMVELDEGPWIMGNLTGVDPDAASIELIGKRVKMKQAKVFPGDKYSAGDGAAPLFELVLMS